ncbi:PREDICTED: protein PET117 homolog, mitochondrial [Bison bison bison]|uniref:Protein PET117 homolog, mitochondrial n=1 Tax=Bison bison bison TaxID=43346 RepID=A0A6P3JAK2_BISBB|nr:PREDICTED: protein PET117 homolog, mitochondrial [Bison bison bison]
MSQGLPGDKVTVSFVPAEEEPLPGELALQSEGDSVFRTSRRGTAAWRAGSAARFPDYDKKNQTLPRPPTASRWKQVDYHVSPEKLPLLVPSPAKGQRAPRLGMVAWQRPALRGDARGGGDARGRGSSSLGPELVGKKEEEEHLVVGLRVERGEWLGAAEPGSPRVGTGNGGGGESVRVLVVRRCCRRGLCPVPLSGNRQTRPTVRLHDGVIRDIERQNRKKENIRLLGEQILLTEQLEAEREKMVLAKGSQET